MCLLCFNEMNGNKNHTSDGVEVQMCKCANVQMLYGFKSKKVRLLSIKK